MLLGTYTQADVYSNNMSETIEVHSMPRLPHLSSVQLTSP